jgi:simple sugar transport system ATP-binding protein
VTTTPASAVEVPPVIEARGITKQYGALTALQGVDLTINPGEIVGLVGDNGAGKSTLIKVLSGAIQPTSGQLLVDGRPIAMHSPLDARRERSRPPLWTSPAPDLTVSEPLHRP